jgi:prophage tail gpP-like protein
MLFDAMQFYRTSYTVQGWRQSDGSLWEVNSLVKVTDELLGLEMMTMLITKVTYTINESGLITQLECVPPDGFRAETSSSGSDSKGWKGKSGKAKTSKETSKDLSFIKGKNE